MEDLLEQQQHRKYRKSRILLMKVQHKASEIRFKHIGNRVMTKLSNRIQLERNGEVSFERLSHLNSGEVDPSDVNNSSEEGCVKSSVYKYSAMEDTRVSRFSHDQILLLQKNMLVLSMLVIFLGMMKIEADVIFPVGNISSQLMNVISCTICILGTLCHILVLLAIVRKLLMRQLDIDQRKVYIRKEERNSCKTGVLMLIRDKEVMVELVLEILLILPHPVSFLQGELYTIYNESYEADLNYSFNDLLSVLMMGKIYLVFRSLVGLTVYSSPRAIRLCSYNNIEHGFFFSIKCLRREYPLACTSIVFVITTFIFSFGFRVSQGNLYYLNLETLPSQIGYESYINCLWYTFITLTSIGYGDYVPITAIGRCLAGIIAIFGMSLNSFLVVALSQYLKMKTQEARSHTTLHRLGERQKLQEESSGALAETIKVAQLLSVNKKDPQMQKRLNPIFETLKGKIDRTKAHSRMIKAITPQQNKSQLMIHEFEVVKNNFKEFYKKQRKIKQKIEKIEEVKGSELRQVRQSFLNEVNSIIYKYRS